MYNQNIKNIIYLTIFCMYILLSFFNEKFLSNMCSIILDNFSDMYEVFLSFNMYHFSKSGPKS